MSSESNNPWTTLASEIKYQNNWIEVTEHQVLNAANAPGIYGTVHFKNIAIGILAVDDEGYTWLVGQYRFPLKAYSWELPEGGGRIGIDPLVSAQRELKEETGLVAREWKKWFEMHLSNSVSDELAIIYLATGLTAGEAEPEEDEVLNVRRVRLEDAFAMAARGEITDAISVAALFKAQLYFAKKSW